MWELLLIKIEYEVNHERQSKVHQNKRSQRAQS